jgi:hypothetical protein
MKVAGASRPDIFSPGAVDYIFRCSEGIPRNINNLCDNALLNGFAAGEPIISRAAVQEVAEIFDVLPPVQSIDEREAPARIFQAAGRAELWAAGNGNGNGNGNGSGNGNGNGRVHMSTDSVLTDLDSSVVAFPSAMTGPEPEIVINEHPTFGESPTTMEELGAAFGRSGLGRGNNGQSL